jgi:hypothetical protein
MAATNVQAFSGDVEITSNLAVDTNTLFVDSMGNKVGIGTTSPTGKLELFSTELDKTHIRVYADTPAVTQDRIFELSDVSGSGLLQMGDRFNNDSTTYKIQLNTEGDSFVNGGNVGIGTTNPSAKLQVGGNAETDPQYLWIRGNRLNEAGEISGIHFYNSLNSGDRGNSRIINSRGTNNYGSNLAFWTNPDDNVPALERMRINSSGYVGIGTNDPLEKLDVNGGNIRLRSTGTARIYNLVTDSDYGNLELSSGLRDQASAPRIKIIAWTGAASVNDDNIITFSTNGSERMKINQVGNVGLGVTNPGVKLHLLGVGTDSGPRLRFETQNNGNSQYTVSGKEIGGIQFGADDFGWSTQHMSSEIVGIHYNPNYSGAQGILAFKTSSTHGSDPTEKMRINQSGYVGIGTTNPNVPLRISGGNNPAFASQWLNWLTNYNINTTRQGETYPVTTLPNNDLIAIYSTHAIGCQTYLFSQGGGLTGSDVRIKKDIIEIDDGEALRILRLLQPKQYKYKDTLHRGEDPVWGFIAQEVAEVLPYSVKLQTEYIPNIMEIVEVSNSNIITFSNFNTSNLESNAASLRLRTFEGLEHDVNIVEIIDENSIRVDDDLTPYLRSLDETGNLVIETTTTVITPEEYSNLTPSEQVGYIEESNTYVKTSNTFIGSELFVFGQEVDNFNFLKKESIFTITTTALQEVDRQLQAERVKVATLETQLTSVLARLDALESA